MAVHTTYSHDTILRTLKAKREVELLVRAYVHAMNAVGNTNQVAKVLSYPDKVRVYMTSPTYEFEKFSEEYGRLLKRHDKNLTELSCWLHVGGYSINGKNQFDLSAQDIKEEILDRAHRLGPAFQSEFNSYLENANNPAHKQSVSATIKRLQNDADVIFIAAKNRKSIFNWNAVPGSTNLINEVTEMLLPFYKAYRYASMQERGDIGNIHINQTADCIKIAITLSQGHNSRFMELTRTAEGYVQNPMSPLMGPPLGEDQNAPMPYDSVIKLMDTLINSKGAKFKADYEAHLKTDGKPEMAPKPKAAKAGLSK